MAKKSSTVHLEESTWGEISEYQKINGNIGRNEAIERMFTERRLLLNLNKFNNKIQENVKNNIDDKKEDKIENVVDTAFNDMPE